jgi:UDP-glucose 4-epimerase
MHPLEKLKGLRILVTGASGFIGRHLARRLALAAPRLFLAMRKPASLASGEVLEMDLTEPGTIERCLSAARPDIVFHLGAFTDVSRNPGLEAKHVAVNYQGTLSLARALAGRPLKRMIHFGTCEEYGDGAVPFVESQEPRPVSPYSASKVRATLAMRELWKKERFPVVIVRPFLTYGPGQDGDRFLAQVVRAAVSDETLPMTPGEQTREFNHIEDVVEGLLQAAVKEGIEGEIINIACGEERRLDEVARLVYRLAGATTGPGLGALPYRKGEAMRFFGSTEKCTRLLDYRPCIRFEEGIENLIDRERSRHG